MYQTSFRNASGLHNNYQKTTAFDMAILGLRILKDFPDESRVFSQKEFVFGMGYKYETLNRTFFDSKPKQNSPFIYFQYDFYPTEKINLIFGGRFDKFEEYKSQFSPKLSGIFEINNNAPIIIAPIKNLAAVMAPGSISFATMAPKI